MSAILELSATSPLWEPEERWRVLIERAVAACGRALGPEWPDRPVSVLLCGDRDIQDLNHRWRNQNKPTNVLSFPAGGPDTPDAPLGDIALAWETIEREARGEGKGIDNHVTHLAVHGVLHLLGFDHETDEDAAAMEDEERRILQTLGVPDPYASQDGPLDGPCEGLTR